MWRRWRLLLASCGPWKECRQSTPMYRSQVKSSICTNRLYGLSKQFHLFNYIMRAHRPNDRCVFSFAQVCLSRREELFQEVYMSERAIGEQQVPVLNQQTVTVLMRQVLGCQEIELLKWQVHEVAGWNGPATRGVYRVAGTWRD